MKLSSRQIRFQGLNINVHTPENQAGHVLFVHGGPGSHSHFFETAIREFDPYRAGDIGWITYDQRGCGMSDGGRLSHAENISDLRALCAHITSELGIRLDAVMGHSYGAWLAYDVLVSEPSSAPRLILTGMGSDFREPRNRSLMMDLFLLKAFQPEDYAKLYPDLVSFDGEPWKLAKDVRAVLDQADLRKHFYWANPAVMQWYERTKSKLEVQESDPTYRTVRETLYAEESQLDGPQMHRLKVPVLWINGMHDFLMSSSPPKSPDLTFLLFKGSGHYPHFEEPERFVNAVRNFVEVA